MAAQKATNQSKAGKTLKLLVPSRVWALLWRIVKRCSGLTQEAKTTKTPQTLSMGLSWWGFRPGSSKSANWGPHLQPPPAATTFKLLTDSQVMLQLIQKAIKQPATTWLCTHGPLLMDIVANLKALTEAGHYVHLGEVKAHAGLAGNILADAAAKMVVTRKNIDADGDLSDISNEDLIEAGIDSTCNVSNNAHEHHEWPLYPIPEHKGVDEKALLEMEVLLQKGQGQMALAQRSARI